MWRGFSLWTTTTRSSTTWCSTSVSSRPSRWCTATTRSTRPRPGPSGPTGCSISPGPGRPADAGVSGHLIRDLGRDIPVLGVCLGHQCIGEVFGGQVVRHQVMHGKTSSISHDGRGVFAGLPQPLTATRYHSLVVAPESVPEVLEVSAWSEDGAVMGLRHRHLPIEGLQFHPESILTDGGHRMIANWLAVCGQPAALAAVAAAEAGLAGQPAVTPA